MRGFGLAGTRQAGALAEAGGPACRGAGQTYKGLRYVRTRVSCRELPD